MERIWGPGAAASLPEPGWDGLQDPSAGWGWGRGGWRVTQAGPQGGVRQFLLWQVQAEGSGDCWFLLQ